MTTAQKSNLMTAYNAARRLANKGMIDHSRLNRALGICQLRQRRNEYGTTVARCLCPDNTVGARRHVGPCKHRIAMMLDEVA